MSKDILDLLNDFCVKHGLDMEFRWKGDVKGSFVLYNAQMRSVLDYCENVFNYKNDEKLILGLVKSGKSTLISAINFFVPHLYYAKHGKILKYFVSVPNKLSLEDETEQSFKGFNNSYGNCIQVKINGEWEKLNSSYGSHFNIFGDIDGKIKRNASSLKEISKFCKIKDGIIFNNKDPFYSELLGKDLSIDDVVIESIIDECHNGTLYSGQQDKLTDYFLSHKVKCGLTFLSATPFEHMSSDMRISYLYVEDSDDVYYVGNRYLMGKNLSLGGEQVVPEIKALDDNLVIKYYVNSDYYNKAVESGNFHDYGSHDDYVNYCDKYLFDFCLDKFKGLDFGGAACRFFRKNDAAKCFIEKYRDKFLENGVRLLGWFGGDLSISFEGFLDDKKIKGGEKYLVLVTGSARMGDYLPKFGGRCCYNYLDWSEDCSVNATFIQGLYGRACGYCPRGVIPCVWLKPRIIDKVEGYIKVKGDVIELGGRAGWGTDSSSRTDSNVSLRMEVCNSPDFVKEFIEKYERIILDQILCKDNIFNSVDEFEKYLGVRKYLVCNKEFYGEKELGKATVAGYSKVGNSLVMGLFWDFVEKKRSELEKFYGKKPLLLGEVLCYDDGTSAVVDLLPQLRSGFNNRDSRTDRTEKAGKLKVQMHIKLVDGVYRFVSITLPCGKSLKRISLKDSCYVNKF